MGTDALDLLGTVATGRSWDRAKQSAWDAAACPHCGATPTFRVAGVLGSSGEPEATTTRWLRCPACLKGSVAIDNVEG